MSGIVKKTYLLLFKYNLKHQITKKDVWVLEGTHNKYDFLSIDGKKYSLTISGDRPPYFAIPYEMFIGDEYV